MASPVLAQEKRAPIEARALGIPEIISDPTPMTYRKVALRYAAVAAVFLAVAVATGSLSLSALAGFAGMVAGIAILFSFVGEND